MKKVIELVKMQLRLSFQSKATIIFTFIMPILFTILFSFSDSPPDKYTFYIADQDNSFYSSNLINMINKSDSYKVEELKEKELNKLISEQKVEVAFVISKGFAKSIEEQSNPTIKVIKMNEVSDTGTVHSISSYINKVQQISAIYNMFITILKESEINSSEKLNKLKDDIYTKAVAQWEEPIIKADFKYLEVNNEKKYNYKSQSSAGYLAFFLCYAMVLGAGEILREKEEGTLKRLLVSSVSKNQILFGKLIGTFILGLMQIILLVSFGMLAFKVNWLKEPFLIIILLLAYLFSLVSIGMLLTGIVKSYAQLNAIGILLIVSTGMIGGTWWPLEIAPEWMQTLSKLTPQGWFMKAATGILWDKIMVIDVWYSVGVLLLMGIISIMISTRIIDLKKMLS